MVKSLVKKVPILRLVHLCFHPSLQNIADFCNDISKFYVLIDLLQQYQGLRCRNTEVNVDSLPWLLSNYYYLSPTFQKIKNTPSPRQFIIFN